jgi:SSS family solute:Na+ symporter
MSQNLLSLLDLVILAAYFILVAWLGMRQARSKQSADDYFVAKRRIPGWVMGLSMFAATLSSFTFIGFPGWTYRHDMQILLREYMSIFAIAVCSLFIIPIYRAVVRVSVFEYLERRYGYFARYYSSLGIVVGSPVGVGVLLYVLCLALNGLTGLPLLWLILAIGVGTLLYTVRGGIEACIYTEAIHGAMFIGTGLLTLVFLLFFAVPGGFEQIVSVASAGGKFRVVDPTFNLHQPTVFIFLWVGLFHFLSNYSAQPYVVQRYLAAPSLKQAVRGSWLSVACCLVTWATFMSIGSLLWAFYQINPGRLGNPNIEPDAIFPYFMGRELPTGMAGLILAGLLASGMSGISSALNSTAACVQSDFYERLTHNTNPRRRLFVSRLSVIVLGTFSIVIALLLMYWKGGVVQFAADVISSILGPIVGGSLLAIFMLGLFTRRTSAGGLYTGMAVGILFSIWAVATNPDNPIGKLTGPHLDFLPTYRWHIWMLFGLTNLIVLTVGYLASVLVFRGHQADPELTVYGYDILPNLGRSLKELVGIKAEPATPITTESQP